MTHKIISIFLNLLLIFYSVAPGISASIAFAQEITPTTAPTQEATPTPSDQPTPTEAPTEVPTATPTQQPVVIATPNVEPSPTVTPDITLTPTLEVLPTPTETIIPSAVAEPTVIPEITPSATDTPTPDNNSPPVSSNNSEPTPSSTVESPTVTPTPTEQAEAPKLTGNLNAVIIKDSNAESVNEIALDINPVNIAPSAQLITDKADYAPTDTAIISGSDFQSNTDYTLIITSSDEPSVNFQTKVTSNNEGSFIYSYQLDGTYRPNYQVEVKDASGNIVATTTFTDSPISGCTNDTGGVNDETGQKDLTKMCVDYAGSPTNIGIKWNWDDVSWSGANTGDACSLFDTDGDGNANYALCVGVNGNPAIEAYTKLYSCTDNDFNNCTGSTLISATPSSTCTTSLQSTDPFSAGSGFPVDTESNCNIVMSEVGGATSTLLDVCSNPSGSPSSNASDCIVFKDHSGKMTVSKILSPNDDPGLFNLQVDGVTQASNIGDGGSTLTTALSKGNHTVGETAGTSTTLANYTSSISCRDLHGTGSTISTTGSNPWTIYVDEDKDILCTITNTRVNNGTINIVKVGENNNSQDFGFDTTGLISLETSSPDFSLDDDLNAALSNTRTFTGVAAGTYTVSEVATDGWTLGSIVCTDPTQNSTSGLPTAPTATINLAAGETVTCTFTNTLNKGNIKVNKMVDTNGDGDYTDTGEELNGTASNSFTWTYRGIGPNVMGTTQSGLTSGSGSLSENTVTNYHLVGWYRNSGQGSCASPDSTTLPASIDIVTNQTVEITICNAIDTGTVIVHKDVQGPNGEDVTDLASHPQVSLDGATGQLINENFTVIYSNVPVGSHTITESFIDSNYTLYGISTTAGQVGTPAGLVVNVVSGQTVDVYVTNRQQSGTITVIKDVVNAAGGAVSDSHSFTVNLSPGTQSDSFAEEDNAVFTVNPGTYTASENDDVNYNELGCKTATGKDDIVVASGGSVTITCTNQQNPGTISGYKYMADGATGILGWAINLYSCTTLGIGCTTFVTNTTTASTGFFSFTNLITGFYQVLEDLTNPNYTPIGVTSHDVTVTPGATIINQNFSNFKNIDITVCKKEDADGNLLTTGDQSFVAGWGLTLNTNETAGNLVRTDENGCYTFTNLGPADNYSVTEENRNGWTPLTDTNFTHDFGTPADGVNQSHTFINAQKGHIIIVKNAINNNTQDFTFQNDFGNGNPATFLLDDDSNVTLPANRDFEVLAGTYSVSEDSVTGWQQESATCDSGETIDSIDVLPGETVTCTFVNEKFAKIILVKNTVGGDGTFDFDATGTGLPTDIDLTTVAGTASQTFEDLDQDNTYSIAETVLSGWDLTSATCNQGETVDDIDIGAGETVTCTFTNTKRGHIIIDKVTDPLSDLQSFNFEASGSGYLNFSLADTDAANDQELVPGTYSVSETVPEGWDQTGATCDNQQTPSNITLGAGETVTCTFINTQRGTISGTKQEVNSDSSFAGVLPDWVIRLFSGNTEVDQTITDESGFFSFTNIVQGVYTLAEDLLSGWTQIFSPSSITLNPGDSSIDNNFGNFQNGSIEGVKFEDLNGDGEQCVYDEEAEEDVCEPTLSDWTIFIDENEDGVLNGDEQSTSTDGDGNYEFSNLGPGTYSVCEEEQEDWIRSRPSESNCESVTISNSDQSSTVDFGNYQNGHITVIKRVVNNDGSEVTDTSTNFGFNIENEASFDLTDDEEETVDVKPGTYQVTEDEPGSNFEFVDCVAEYDGQEAGVEIARGEEVTLESNDTVTVTCTNKQKFGKIEVTKYQDNDGDGVQDEGEPVLEGWNMHLSQGEEFSANETTNLLGLATFDNLLSGTYILSESEEEGWTLTNIECLVDRQDGNDTSNEHEVVVSAGETTTCKIGNQQESPILTITKSNNKTGVDLTAGSSVLYTLTVEATQSGVTNVVVKDLLPDGFKYRGSSWTASSNVNPGLIVAEPVYASPGTWNLGNMIVGETITLTLIADIDGGKQPGLYKDLAWAQGTSLAETQVLANAENPGFVDDNFVGTEVNIVKDPDGTASNVEKEELRGEVLGASIAMPETGANAGWLALAGLLLAFGIGSTIIGMNLRRKHV